MCVCVFIYVCVCASMLERGRFFIEYKHKIDKNMNKEIRSLLFYTILYSNYYSIQSMTETNLNVGKKYYDPHLI